MKTVLVVEQTVEVQPEGGGVIGISQNVIWKSVTLERWHSTDVETAATRLFVLKQ